METKPKCCHPECTNVVTSKGNGRLRRVCHKHRTTCQKPKEPEVCSTPGCTNFRHKGTHGGLCDQCRAKRKAERLAKQTAKRLERQATRRCPEPDCTSLCGHRCRFCDQHRTEKKLAKVAKKKALSAARSRRKQEWRQSQPCWLCGWNRATCDRHRLVPGEHGGRYTPANVIFVCPGCHRIVTHDPQAIFAELTRAVQEHQLIEEHLMTIADTLPAVWKLFMGAGLQPAADRSC